MELTFLPLSPCLITYKAKVKTCFLKNFQKGKLKSVIYKNYSDSHYASLHGSLQQQLQLQVLLVQALLALHTWICHFLFFLADPLKGHQVGWKASKLPSSALSTDCSAGFKPGLSSDHSLTATHLSCSCPAWSWLHAAASGYCSAERSGHPGLRSHALCSRFPVHGCIQTSLSISPDFTM